MNQRLQPQACAGSGCMVGQGGAWVWDQTNIDLILALQLAGYGRLESYLSLCLFICKMRLKEIYTTCVASGLNKEE